MKTIFGEMVFMAAVCWFWTIMFSIPLASFLFDHDVLFAAIQLLAIVGGAWSGFR